ncbi:MAG TPA: alanine--tRNA ligase, partial [Acidobacteriaceae bacterium]|nr:alanine--tRNA ligase [Acidobacteriaceae bacterium]
MEKRSGSQIREDFLRFFEGKKSLATGQGHRRVHSSSLVPANDPTLLFTNAGMNQFKDVFLGAERRDYTRATTSQKCVRAGGKHNDLENVGFTRRHHTFFEMLGNFSFGDYFKKDAIAYAWELLTSSEWFGIDPSKLYVTIFEGDASVPRDDEAERYWIEVGVPEERIFQMGAKDNFWQMGETGPCGPCSEIYYDFGQESGDDPNVDKPFPEDEARYVEIWNLVFMQFDRSVDSGGKATLTPLPKPSIDTGMGLERVACVLQNVVSNFDTDLFVPLIERAKELVGGVKSRDEKTTASLRIIADHARCATFLISDGVLPSNEGRGYVLRKIMRRGIRHGRLLGQERPFMHEMVYAVRDEMAGAYPELKESADRVVKVVLAEEQQFARTLQLGLGQMNEETLRSGVAAFHLYETYGMPLDFMVDAARDAGIAFDMEGFEHARAEEQARARASWKGGSQKTAAPVYRELGKTEFEGYTSLRVDGAKVLALVKDGLGAAELKAGEAGEIVLDAT